MIRMAVAAINFFAAGARRQSTVDDACDLAKS
jgi:hypothetical protein